MVGCPVESGNSRPSLCAASCCRLPLFGAPKGQEKGNVRGTLHTGDADRVLAKDRKLVPTQVVSPTEIRFALDAEALRTAGRFDLVVVNPAPVAPLFSKGMWGNGTSNQAHLIVNYKY